MFGVLALNLLWISTKKTEQRPKMDLSYDFITFTNALHDLFDAEKEY